MLKILPFLSTPNRSMCWRRLEREPTAEGLPRSTGEGCVDTPRGSGNLLYYYFNKAIYHDLYVCTCHMHTFRFIDPLESMNRIYLWKPPQLCSTHILTSKLVSNYHLIGLIMHDCIHTWLTIIPLFALLHTCGSPFNCASDNLLKNVCLLKYILFIFVQDLHWSYHRLANYMG